MRYKAVITGDIVHSREVSDLQSLLQVLKDAVHEIEAVLGSIIKFEIYRGDSFQMLINEPENAIRIAILIRSKLRSETPYSDEEDANIPLEKLWDARVSIGIGSVNKAESRVVESTGEAFELSGNQVDAMKKLPDRIKLLSGWANLNEQFDALMKLSDAIISRWTLSSSAAVYRQLLFNETQKKIAQNLKISQPAVHKRLSIANIDAIKSMLNYLNITIKEQTNGI